MSETSECRERRGTREDIDGESLRHIETRYDIEIVDARRIVEIIPSKRILKIDNMIKGSEIIVENPSGSNESSVFAIRDIDPCLSTPRIGHIWIEIECIWTTEHPIRLHREIIRTYHYRPRSHIWDEDLGGDDRVMREDETIYSRFFLSNRSEIF
jgi:hypothetical protein